MKKLLAVIFCLFLLPLAYAQTGYGEGGYGEGGYGTGTPPQPSSGSSGSSGGGGGGTALSSVNIRNDREVTLSFSEVFRFRLDGDSAQHSIVLMGIDTSGNAKVRISSFFQYVDLPRNTPVQIDLDDDKVMDMVLKLKSHTRTSITFDVSPYVVTEEYPLGGSTGTSEPIGNSEESTQVPSEQQPSTSEETSSAEEEPEVSVTAKIEEPKSSSMVWWVLGAIALVGVSIYLFNKRKKKDGEQEAQYKHK